MRVFKLLHIKVHALAHIANIAFDACLFAVLRYLWLPVQFWYCCRLAKIIEILSCLEASIHLGWVG